jgi:hypothetical protein
MLFHGLNRLTLSLFAAWYWAAVNFFSYILSIAIAVLILLWPTIGFVKSRSGDPIFSPSLDLLLAGWISTLFL